MLAQIIRLRGAGFKTADSGRRDKVTLWFVPMVMLIAALTL